MVIPTAQSDLEDGNSDWLTWWSHVQQALPSLFDGTGSRIGQEVAEAAGETVQRYHLIETELDSLRADQLASSTPMKRRLARLFLRTSAPAPEQRVRERRQQREQMLRTLRRYA
jgi:hypothetical protein